VDESKIAHTVGGGDGIGRNCPLTGDMVTTTAMVMKIRECTMVLDVNVVVAVIVVVIGGPKRLKCGHSGS
jgi:hypothetical protein